MNMKGILSRALAVGMALGLMLPASLPAMAASTTQNYGVKVSNEKLYLTKDGRNAKTFTLDNTEMRLMLSTKGNVLIGFTPKSTGKTTNTSIGNGDEAVVTGSMDTLVVAASLPSTKTVTISGSIRDLTIESAAKVILGKDAAITNLNVTNPNAVVTGQEGSQVKKVSTVQGAKVTGVNTVTSFSNLTQQQASQVSANAKYKTYVEMDEKTSNYTKSTSFDGDTIYMEGNTGVTVRQALYDVTLKVYREEDDGDDVRVSGTWKFVNASDANTTASGKYQYRFTPSNTDLYPVTTLTIDFTGNGTTRTLSKPELEFEGRSHGSADNIQILVGIPSTIDDDDRLYIYVNSKEYLKEYLSDSDAGDDLSYTIDATEILDAEDLESGDKVKIKVKVKRTSYDSDGEEKSGGASATSKTISYEID